MTDLERAEVEKNIKSLRPDLSATAPEDIDGWESGYRQAKRDMLDLLAAKPAVTPTDANPERLTDAEWLATHGGGGYVATDWSAPFETDED